MCELYKRTTPLYSFLWQDNVPFSVQLSLSVMSDSLWPHGLQQARLPCPSPSLGACSNSCPLSWWCHPTISSSVVPFSSHLQSFPASGSFQMSQFFTSGGQNIGVYVYICTYICMWASLVGFPCGSAGKESTCNVGDWVWSLGWEDPLEKGKATRSSMLAWRLPWTVKSMGSQRVGHKWVTELNYFFKLSDILCVCMLSQSVISTLCDSTVAH